MIGINLFITRLKKALQEQQAFVVFRKPDSDSLKAYYPEKVKFSKEKDLSGSGFVFSPFDPSCATVLFPSNSSDIQETNWKPDAHELKRVDSKNHRSYHDADEKLKHIELVDKALDLLNHNHLSKVVLSRKEALENTTIEPLEIFFRLVSNYPNAFVYLWHHPEIGLWMGASPETLIRVEGLTFKTIALAGTQLYQGETQVDWGNKELEEQHFVTTQIMEELEGYLTNIDEPLTVKAGNLLHLKTVLAGRMNSDHDLENIVRRIHPTAAVCGMPRDRALDFINEFETYSREYYTGFLGELRAPAANRSHLFVNLRCMRLFPVEQRSWIYVGGGITKSSVPEKEWEETVAKSETMKKVLVI